MKYLSTAQECLAGRGNKPINLQLLMKNKPEVFLTYISF